VSGNPETKAALITSLDFRPAGCSLLVPDTGCVMSIEPKLSRRTFSLCLVPCVVFLPRIATAQEDGRAEPYEEPFPVSYKDRQKVPKKYRRQELPYRTHYQPGMLIIDTTDRFLYLVLDGGRALRYGIGVGRDGFAWAGVAEVARKAPWPRWIPPKEMVARDAFAAEWADGMPGGPKNPLGARALYLHAEGADTLYRIHGTNQPASIGRAVSSGCVRLLNADIIDLYERVNVGAKVVVLEASGETAFAQSIEQSPAPALQPAPKSQRITRRANTTQVESFKKVAARPALVRKTNFNLAKAKQTSQ
jgi:lipoprotein-anchoring transpeptidase ErfK/SrfK